MRAHFKLSPVGGHQPGQPAVGGISTAYSQPGYATICNAPEDAPKCFNC
jgi:hypothetical protein